MKKRLISIERENILYNQVVEKMEREKFYLQHDCSINALAAALHTDPRYIRSMVKDRMNVTFTAYLHQLRIGEAKLLLGRKRFLDTNIEAIAEKVGFQNRQSFYNAFTQIEGVTPRQWKLENNKHLLHNDKN